MDRDVALGIVTVLGTLKTAMQALATNTTPSTENRSVEPDPEENQRSVPAEDPEEPEAPEEEPEPVTKEKK